MNVLTQVVKSNDEFGAFQIWGKQPPLNPKHLGESCFSKPRDVLLTPSRHLINSCYGGI